MEEQGDGDCFLRRFETGVVELEGLDDDLRVFATCCGRQR